MNQWFKRLVILIAGDPDEFQLEHRNLNGACFIAIVGVIFASLVDSLVYFSLYYNITVITAGIIYVILYYLSRIKRKVNNINILFLIISLISWSIAWFLSQGIEGTTPYIFFDLIFISLITFKTDKYRVVVFTYTLSLAVLLFLQFTNQSLITPYINKSVQLTDLSIAFIITMLIFSYLAISLKKNYENEREKVEKQKIEIEKQNKEIQEKNAELEEKQEEINAQKEKILLQKAELEEINRELILIDEMKSSFFTNISHEFRTPLTLIMGPLESLLENTTDKKLAAEYSLMLRHSERLFLLINQLLDISKIEKGKMQLVLKEANMNTAIRTITSSFEPFASDKGISIYLEEKDNDIRAFFDADKLEKILYNLLSNAFKFTEKDGKIEVQIQRSANKKNVEITVKDNGIGIQAEKLPHIFDRFYQVEENKSHQYGDGGTGIGLALTKELVTLHEGTIEVSSIPGSGTTFKISLPIDKTSYTGENITFKDEELEAKISGLLNAPNYMPEPGNIPVNKPSDNRKTILIVEDNPDMRTHLVKSISNRYHLEEASNGEDGIQKAVDLQPDLILSDIMMPGVDGLRLTLAIKENPLTSHIPVIILTAKADEESKLEGLLLHADDYITKPFRMKELMARINSQIVNREKLRDKFKKTITVVPSEITTSSLDEQFLQKVLNIIEKNMSNPAFSVDDLCREMSMSRTNIHLKLKAITNQSTTEFIRSIRLKRAAQLIRQKAGNTGEIADMTGFSNPQYFSRCFKEYFKVSPSEY